MRSKKNSNNYFKKGGSSGSAKSTNTRKLSQRPTPSSATFKSIFKIMSKFNHTKDIVNNIRSHINYLDLAKGNTVVYNINGGIINGDVYNKNKKHVAYIETHTFAPQTRHIFTGPNDIDDIDYAEGQPKDLIEGLLIPDNCTRIKKNAFEGFNNLKFVIFVEPINIEDINKIKFKKSTNPQLRIIEDSAFSMCTSLIDFPFELCHNLSSIGYQDGDGESFAKCPLQKTIVLPKNIKETGPNTFDNTHTKEIIFHPETILETGTKLLDMCQNIQLNKLVGPPHILAQHDILQSCNRFDINSPFKITVHKRDSNKEIVKDVFFNFKRTELSSLKDGDFDFYEYLAKHDKLKRFGNVGDYILIGKVGDTVFKPSDRDLNLKIGDTVVYGDEIDNFAFGNVDPNSLQLRYVDESGGSNEGTGIVNDLYVPNKGGIIQNGKLYIALGRNRNRRNKRNRSNKMKKTNVKRQSRKGSKRVIKKYNK